MKAMKIVAALENDMSQGKADTKKALETEIVVFAKISNKDGLDKADRKEHHVQLEATLTTGHRCRVRKTSVDGKDEYVFTMKVKKQSEDPTVDAWIENNIIVDEDFFNSFREVAEREISKTRYVFNSTKVEMAIRGDNGDPQLVEIPNVQYEVDVFDNKPEQGLESCKIDIEVDNILNFLNTNFPSVREINMNVKVSHLPFEPMDPVLANTDDEDQRKYIDGLWKIWAKILNKAE